MGWVDAWMRQGCSAIGSAGFTTGTVVAPISRAAHAELVFSLVDWPSSYARDWWLLYIFLEDFGFDIKFLVFAVDSFTS